MRPAAGWPGGLSLGRAGCAAALMLFVLAGCAGAENGAARRSTPDTVSANDADTASDRAAQTVPGATDDDAATGGEPEVAAIPTPPPPPPVPDPESFLQKTGAAISQLLGTPGFVRRDPPAELWQYRTSSCTLDLFFYADENDDYRLDYLDFRGIDRTKSARDACLREIIQPTENRADSGSG